MIAIANPLKPINVMSSTVTQLLEKPKKTGIELRLVEALNPPVAAILDPATIPKFENQLNAPPPAYEPNAVITREGILQHEYTVVMASFNQQILPPSMNLLTQVWGYGGAAIDAMTGKSLGFVKSSPGPIRSRKRNTNQGQMAKQHRVTVHVCSRPYDSLG